MNEKEYRELILSFIASLTLCDHMGDVAGAVSAVLKKLSISLEWDDWSELGSRLAKRGIKTLYGTSLSQDEEEAA